ncbi:MAG: hypothetical protein UDQ92_07795 [Lachnospiraceae bacterium]|nr:hypothetical protein [Lachnospiraceae bacterium]
MKKYKEIIFRLLFICMLIGVTSASLTFMGVIGHTENVVTDTEKEGDEGDEMAETTEDWHIVFKGFSFLVKPAGTAIIHESGCLNVRSCDDYLIQIDVEEKTMDDFWDNRAERVQSIENSGYVIVLPPEKTQIGGKEYVKYIVSLANERGAAFENSYFGVLIRQASDKERILTTIRFDGTDMDALNAEQKAAIYEKAFVQARAIADSAVETEETNDMVGTYWQENVYMETGLVDSIVDKDTVVSYKLPDQYKLLSDNLAGKSYYADTEKRNVLVSVVPYSWMSAKDMAESRRRAGISKVVDEGRYEVNGVIYYYYAYSVLHIKGEKRSCTYHFTAYADLKNGDIYVICGDAADNPQAMEPHGYYDFMDIKEECYP